MKFNKNYTSKFVLIKFTLKGQSNEILEPHFFHNSNQLGPLTNELKYFRFWFRFRRDIHIFKNFPGVCDLGESISPGYHTAQSQSPRGIILRKVNLPGVSYPGESVFSTLKYEYLCENETKNENNLTRWSVTQAGSNYEKNGGPKSRWTVPLI